MSVFMTMEYAVLPILAMIIVAGLEQASLFAHGIMEVFDAKKPTTTRCPYLSPCIPLHALANDEWFPFVFYLSGRQTCKALGNDPECHLRGVRGA
jgi:hypothetical protein